MLGQRGLTLFVALVALVSLGPRASAQESAPDVYRATIDDAVREFADGHWEEARALFKHAHELSPNARTLRGMGMAAFELRMYVQSIRELQAALKDSRKPLDATMRAQVNALVDNASKFVGQLRVELQPAGAKPLVDGRELSAESDGSVLLDAGTHTVSATADGYKPSNLRVNVEGGTQQSVRVQLEPLLNAQASVPAIDLGHQAPEAQAPDQPPPAPPLAPKQSEPPAQADSHLGTYAWIALAGAASFGVAGGVFWAVGGAQYDDAKATCKTTCNEGAISDVKSSDTLTTVFLGLSLASGVAAGVLFVLDAGGSSEHEAVAAHAEPRTGALTLALRPTGATLKGQF